MFVNISHPAVGKAHIYQALLSVILKEHLHCRTDVPTLPQADSNSRRPHVAHALAGT